jgi:murein DD-endopeptidase MepM/ murein hydrolase activator NlpD
MSLRIGLLLFLSILVLQVSAQSTPLEEADYNTENPESEVKEVEDFTDPTAGIYGTWNTSKIHYFKDSTFLKTLDTLVIPLISDSNTYYHPVPGSITSRFGPRRYRWHYGTDIDLITGDTVRAAFGGIIRINIYDPGYGRTIVIRHPNGLETLYAHLSLTLVDTGDFVDAGQVIGLGGNTGRSYGSHLHFETRYRGKAIDPEKLIDFTSGELRRDTLVMTKETFDYLPKLEALKSAKYHKIRQGDTLTKIARKYGTSVKTLCRLNGIKQTTILRVGRTLRVR